MDDFIWTGNIAIPAGITKDEMINLDFLDKKENLIMMGGVGPGESFRLSQSMQSLKKR